MTISGPSRTIPSHLEPLPPHLVQLHVTSTSQHGTRTKSAQSIQAWATTEAQRRLEESGEWEKIKYKPSGSEGSVGV
jgi:hypothetical protein